MVLVLTDGRPAAECVGFGPLNYTTKADTGLLPSYF